MTQPINAYLGSPAPLTGVINTPPPGSAPSTAGAQSTTVTGSNGDIIAAPPAANTQTGPLYTNNGTPPASKDITLGGITASTGQTNAQVANAFVNPQSQNIYGQIGGLANLQNAPDYANAPLAGLTALGATTNAGATNIGNTATAGNTNINTGTTNALTSGQVAQINALNQQAQGQGPSVAAVQAKQTADANVANQMAMLASQRGSGNTALGLRSAGNAAAVAQQQGVQAATLGRAQEALTAQGQLTGALGTANSQAAQTAQAQAALSNQNVLANAAGINQANQAQGSLNQNLNLQNAAAANQAMLQQGSMDQQTTLANQSAQAQAQALNTQEQNNAVQAGMTQSNNDVQAAENYENLITNQSTALQGINAGVQINQGNNQMGMVGAGIGGVGALGAAGIAAYGAQTSDRNLKKNIKSGNKSIKSFLSIIEKQSNKQNTMFNINL